MVRIEISIALFEEIERKFKKESVKIFDLMESLKENPKKGKLVGTVGGLVIKQIKYGSFRFFFITDGFKLKMLDEKGLVDILLRFVRMAHKNYQQKTIHEIKEVLRKVGPYGFK